MSICQKDRRRSDILAGELKKHRLEACTGLDAPQPSLPQPSLCGVVGAWEYGLCVTRPSSSACFLKSPSP